MQVYIVRVLLTMSVHVHVPYRVLRNLTPKCQSNLRKSYTCMHGKMSNNQVKVNCPTTTDLLAEADLTDALS